MAKLTRESRLRERRLDKQARKDARKRNALQPDDPGAELVTENEQLGEDDARHDVDVTVGALGSDATLK